MLYNTHLETLIRVVEAGSFRRAAEQIGISPSAVLKQITLLEQDLQVTLFDRSRKGVSLTEAGESLYRDAKYIVRYCGTAGEKARELYTQQTHYVRVGISVLNPAAELTELWPKIRQLCPDLRCRFVPFECSFAGMDQAFATLGQDADLIIAVYDSRFLERFGLQAVPLHPIRAGIAASPDHPLPWDGKTPASLDVLEGRTLLLPGKGICLAADALRRELEEERPGIHIEDFDMYTMNVFYECQNTDKCLFTFNSWEKGRMLLSHVPMDWDYNSSYGILASREPTPNTARVLEVAAQLIECS